MAADELIVNLNSYKFQLQQVEAALTTEPGNEDLLKLKKDLSEVIELTQELVRNQTGGDSNVGSKDTLGDRGTFGGGVGSSSKSSLLSKSLTKSWKIDDRCMCMCTATGKYSEGIVTTISEDGQCTVAFEQTGSSEVTNLSLLKPLPKKRSIIVTGFIDDPKRSKKQMAKEQREHKKKKQHKKAERMKELEEEREHEKGKWQNFNTKAFSKNKKGHVKRSIFASPDSVSGRVGVGTCGIGGKPMTDYHHQEKWKK